MASYNSDSSDGEFSETKVLLGYASRDAEDETISKLGGRPEWLDPEKPPSAALARCASCKDLMVLILQLNAELPEKFPGHDRRLYIFACKRTSCRRKNGSIRALRGVRMWADEETMVIPEADPVPKQEEPKSNFTDNGPALGNALFGTRAFGEGASSAGANPFSSSNTNPFGTQHNSSNPFSSSSHQNPASSQPQLQDSTASEKEQRAKEEESPELSKTFAETLSLNNNNKNKNNNGAGSSSNQPTSSTLIHESWPDSSSQPTPYPTLYLAEAEYETLDLTPAKIPENAQMEAADAPETVSALDKEAFESSMDATFQKFADRLAQNPDQVIRYEFGGVPLLYSKTDVVGEKLSKGSMPGCPNCGGKRIFEVQLTPNAITDLESDDMSLEGMEWGTIIVGVCEKNCLPRNIGKGEAGYLEEWAGVQWEELVKQK
ncbi:hypothetical protein E4U43_001777 [Claviceps pusilla]|uniref:Programmed cell death protein 2 C-terminal domain-containing protein n=1 Tax=Claviceps pusilla TaxID=123648 RepID=A0A9P7T058_9HYPO|nr:hypothetical protein E4U43_001777 [Claviceps pusilla]